MPAPVTDPFASIAQQAPAAPPAGATPPAAPTGFQDPFASLATSAPAKTTTPPPAAGITGVNEDHVDNYLRKAAGVLEGATRLVTGQDVLAGAGAGVERTLAGADRLARKLSGSQPTQIEQGLQNEAARPTTGVAQKVGEAGETIGEFFTGEELLGLLGKAGAAMTGVEKLKQAQQIATVMQKSPMIAKLVHIGLSAVKAGTVGAAQEEVRTGGDEEGQPGRVGLETGVLAGLTHGAAEGVSALARSIAPRTVEIAGEKIPALASQVDRQGNLTGAAAEGAPKVAQAQQQGGQNIIRNVAQDAVEKTLNEINATRQVAARAGETASQLPAGEGAKPFFSLGTTPPTEEAEGDLLQNAGKAPRHAFEQPQFTEGSRPKPRGGVNEGSQGADIETAETPEARADRVGGGGTLSTNDPRQAEAWRYQLQELMDSKEFGQLSDQEQARVRTGHEQLEQQLGLYYNSPYANRFAPADVAAARANVRDFGQAANEIQSAAQPVYAALDRVSNGQFTKLRRQAALAARAIKTSADPEAAQTRLDQANDAIGDLITRHSSELGQQDYNAARLAWQRSTTLDGVHNTIERMANGITLEESERAGLPRVITGNAKQLQNWLSQGNNATRLQQIIGRDGIDNLKRMSVLLSKVDTARSTSNVLLHTAHELHRSLREGAVLGGLAGEALGGHWATGAGIGAGVGAVSFTAKQVLRAAAASPRVGQLVEYAATHGVPAEQYAPLIARALVVDDRQQETDEAEEEQ